MRTMVLEYLHTWRGHIFGVFIYVFMVWSIFQYSMVRIWVPVPSGVRGPAARRWPASPQAPQAPRARAPPPSAPPSAPPAAPAGPGGPEGTASLERSSEDLPWIHRRSKKIQKEGKESSRCLNMEYGMMCSVLFWFSSWNMLGINTVGIVPLARPKAHLGGALLSVDAKNLVTFRQTKNEPPGKPWKTMENHGKPWKTQCHPVPIVLGTFQSAGNFGHYQAYRFRSRIPTGICGALQVFAALLRKFWHSCQ